jgi:hypothetical protein
MIVDVSDLLIFVSKNENEHCFSKLCLKLISVSNSSFTSLEYFVWKVKDDNEQIYFTQFYSCTKRKLQKWDFFVCVVMEAGALQEKLL